MNNMEKQKAESIKKSLDFLWECTREMNAYFQIIQNIIKNKSLNADLISILTAFYNTIIINVDNLGNILIGLKSIFRSR